MKLRSFLLPILAAGILSAQPVATQHSQARRMDMVQRLTKSLNLTADQQAQARTIFQNARQQTKAMAPQLKQEHQAMSAAIKGDNEAQIDQLTQQNASLNSQARAIHAKAMAKFYSILTPDQKTAFDQRAHRRAVNAAAQHKAVKQG